MEKKIVKVELPMFLHRKPDGTSSVHNWDRTVDHNGRVDEFNISQYGACMGKVIVYGEYEDIEGSPVEKLVEGLERALEKDRADSQVRHNKLLERIGQLRSLTHEATE